MSPRPLPPLVEDTSDPQQVAFGRRKERDLVQEDRERWRTQLSTYEGRAFVWAVLGRLPGTQDIHGDTAFVYRELGRRSVWLELYVAIDQHPELAAQMQQEGLARDRKAARAIAAQRETERAAETEEFPT